MVLFTFRIVVAAQTYRQKMLEENGPRPSGQRNQGQGRNRRPNRQQRRDRPGASRNGPNADAGRANATERAALATLLAKKRQTIQSSRLNTQSARASIENEVTDARKELLGLPAAYGPTNSVDLNGVKASLVAEVQQATASRMAGLQGAGIGSSELGELTNLQQEMVANIEGANPQVVSEGSRAAYLENAEKMRDEAISRLDEIYGEAMAQLDAVDAAEDLRIQQALASVDGAEDQASAFMATAGADVQGMAQRVSSTVDRSLQVNRPTSLPTNQVNKSIRELRAKTRAGTRDLAKTAAPSQDEVKAVIRKSAGVDGFEGRLDRAGDNVKRRQGSQRSRPTPSSGQREKTPAPQARQAVTQGEAPDARETGESALGWGGAIFAGFGRALSDVVGATKENFATVVAGAALFAVVAAFSAALAMVVGLALVVLAGITAAKEVSGILQGNGSDEEKAEAVGYAVATLLAAILLRKLTKRPSKKDDDEQKADGDKAPEAPAPEKTSKKDKKKSNKPPSRTGRGLRAGLAGMMGGGAAAHLVGSQSGGGSTKNNDDEQQRRRQPEPGPPKDVTPYRGDKGTFRPQGQRRSSSRS